MLQDDRLGRAVSLKEMTNLMSEYLDAPYALETVRVALKKMGVGGQETHVEGGRGRFYLYDPLLCWVLATIFHRPDLGSDKLTKVVANRRALMTEQSSETSAAHPRKRESIQSAVAYYSFITDLEYGMDVRHLSAIVTAHPECVRLSLGKDGVLMKKMLERYQRAVSDWSYRSFREPVEDELLTTLPDAKHLLFSEIGDVFSSHSPLAPSELSTLHEIDREDPA